MSMVPIGLYAAGLAAYAVHPKHPKTEDIQKLGDDIKHLLTNHRDNTLSSDDIETLKGLVSPTLLMMSTVAGFLVSMGVHRDAASAAEVEDLSDRLDDHIAVHHAPHRYFTQ